MSTFLYPNSGALAIAGLVQAGLASAVVKLFKSNIDLAPTTAVADLDAIECDFSGYGAKTITAFNDPYLADAGGASISSGYIQWDWVAPTPPDPEVENSVYGFYMVDAGGALICAGKFDTPLPMGFVGQSVPLTVTLNYGAGA